MRNKTFEKAYIECLRADLADSLAYDKMLSQIKPIGKYALAMNPALRRERIEFRKVLREAIRKSK